MTNTTGLRDRAALRRSGRRTPLHSVRTLLSWTLAMVTAVVLAVSGAGGTYALLSSSAPTGSASTIKSGTATLAVSSALSMPNTAMYPGLRILGSATVANTGDVPLAVQLTNLVGPSSSTAFSQALTVGVASAASASACSSGNVTSSWTTGTFASPTAAQIGAVLPAGSSTVLCVSVTLASNAPTGAQGQSASNFSLTVNGAQA